MTDFLVHWVANIPSFAAPFALGALGLIISEKSGVLTLGAEGYMLIGALSGVGAVLLLGGYPVAALLVAAFATAIFSLIFAVLTVTLRVNQVIAGLAITFLAYGLTSLVATQQGWTNVSIGGLGRLHIDGLSDIPIVGPILFQQDIVGYLLIPIFVGVVYVLTRTMVGLRLRAVGDGPDAADAAGINVGLYRYGAVMAGAALVGMAGAYLSVGIAKLWVDGMSGGRGLIAIALVIFARWQPWRALAGAILFGSIEALIPRVAAIGLQVPQYFVMMTPYLATLAVMVWASSRGGLRAELAAPRALGQPHTREERR
jgi:ABC-type uncharacterized transport system permease subunit